jgi:hypothetical protein
MTGITALWLPILVSAVIVFLASSIIHMATSWHKSDFAPIPDEDGVLNALRPFNIPPGDYMAPRADSMEDMRSESFKAKFARGPVFIMTMMPGGSMAMGGQLTKWFLYLVVIACFSAYIAGRALPPGSDYLHIFRFVGATAFLSHVMGQWPGWIWYRRSLTTTIKMTIDGLLFALLTAGTFGWLWPKM